MPLYSVAILLTKRASQLLWLTLLYCLANQAAAESQSYFLPDIPAKRAQSLIQHMILMDRQDEIIPLSSLAADYYGLYLPDATGSPQGGVLILHDNQQHGHWPDIVAPLREYLPQHGWTTLTIELPDIPPRKRIARAKLASQPLAVEVDSATAESENTSATDPIASNKEGEPALTEEATDNAGTDEQGKPEELQEKPTTESLEPALPKLAELPELSGETITETAVPTAPKVDPEKFYREQNQQRILAAIEYLKSKGQLNLAIIGYGIGAAWAIDYLAQQNDTKDDKNNKGLALVTIDAMPSRHSSKRMTQQLAELKIPFLDLIQPNETSLRKQGKIRLAIMKRNKNVKFQQIITSNMANYDDTESPTNRRIRGWLKTNAGGTLVKMKP